MNKYNIQKLLSGIIWLLIYIPTYTVVYYLHIIEMAEEDQLVKRDLNESPSKEDIIEESSLNEDEEEDKVDASLDEMVEDMCHKRRNCFDIDIEHKNINSFVEFIKSEFQCKLTVTGVFGVKYKERKKKEKRKSIKNETKAFIMKEEVEDEQKCGADPYSQGYCLECNKQFKSRQGYLTHWKIMHEVKEKRLECDRCDFRTDYEFKLKHHKWKTHETDRTHKTCERCGKTFSKNYKYRLHIEEVHGDKMLFCDKCDYSTKIRRYLNEHVKKQHSEGDTGRLEKELFCEFCSFTTKYHQSLQDHIDRKHRNIEYKCDHEHCNFATNSKRKLCDHKAEHKGELFPCPTCGKAFPSKKKLKYHLNNSHKPQIERQCEFCDYKTTSLKMFTKHVEWRHSRADYKERYKGWDWGVMREKWRQGKEQDRGKLEEGSSPSSL